MLDVHPPHHAATTKRDFFIHLATIIIGLLIAIGLEQSVEALHRLHERHVLEAALHAECEDNKDRAEANFSAYYDEMEWLLGLHGDIQKMLAAGERANLPYRKLHHRPRPLPDDAAYTGGSVHLTTAVWDTAGADNRLALLPDRMAREYSFLYHIRGERFSQLRDEARENVSRQHAFEARFADAGTPETPVLARMSAADLKEYDALVMQSFEAVHDEKFTLLVVYATDNAVLQGLYDNSMPRFYRKAAAAFPDDFAKMAQQIAAEDAARDKAAKSPAMKAVK